MRPASSSLDLLAGGHGSGDAHGVRDLPAPLLDGGEFAVHRLDHLMEDFAIRCFQLAADGIVRAVGDRRRTFDNRAIGGVIVLGPLVCGHVQQKLESYFDRDLASSRRSAR